MLVKFVATLLALQLAGAQYGPIKKQPKHTTTPFPIVEPDYSPEVNSVEENSGALPGSYSRPQTPAGAVSAPDNPWLSGVIKQNPYSGSRSPAPAYPAPAPAPAYPAPAPAPAYQPAPTIACNAPGYVCTPRQQCQGGVTSSPGTGASQCDANSQVCCRQEQPQPAYQPPPQPAPAPAPQPAYRPQPQPAYRPPPPPPQPAYQPQPQPAYQPQPQARPYQPPAPIGGSIYDSQPPPSRPRPVPQYTNNYVTEAPIQRYTGPLNTTPHPGCAAALKCVEEIYCTWDGIMADVPQSFTREQIDNKVPLSDCQNIETGIIGKCCRDPNYKDPWPAGMMMNSGPFDDGQYHPGVIHSGGAPLPAPQQPTYTQPAYVPQQPAYVPQPKPLPQYTPNVPAYAPQPQPQPQPQYTPNVPAYAPQPQPTFNARPSGTERASCGPTATCTPHNLCPGERQSQPGKACRVPNDDSTGVCCAKLQYPAEANNQQYRPPSNKPSTNPYFAPQPKPVPQPNPYGAPQPKPTPAPQQAPQPQYNVPRPAPAPQPIPQPQPNPYVAPQPKPAPQPNPYVAPQPKPAPQPNPYVAPQPKPAPQPNPYVAPQPKPAPQPNPYVAPQPKPAPQPNPYVAPQPKPAPQPNPYVAPQPTPQAVDRTAFTEPKPEKTNEIESETPRPAAPILTTAPPPFIRVTTAKPQTPAEPEPTPAAAPEPGKECGVRRTVPRPNGPEGAETGFGEFPWHAQVLTSQDQKPACSGAILAENIVVTAAHCVNSLTAQQILVKAGDWKLASQNPTEEPQPVQIRNVAAIAVHPAFNPNSRANDMAVLVLQDPLQFDQHVDKLCLGKDTAPGQPPSGTNCLITGWGKDATRANAPGSTLHSIPVSFMPNSQCQEAFKNTQNLGKYFKLHESFTCALPNSPNHDLCQVDAGSPIACQKPDGKYELSGIYSWDTGCHPNTNTPVAMNKPDKEFIQSVMDKPVEEIKKETDAERHRQDALGQAAQEAQAVKPGFSQGYGK